MSAAGWGSRTGGVTLYSSITTCDPQKEATACFSQLCYLTVDNNLEKGHIPTKKNYGWLHVYAGKCITNNLDECQRKEQRGRQKRTDKPLRTVTLNITSSPVLQYSLITPKCPFISPQPCITKKSSYGCLVIYIYC